MQTVIELAMYTAVAVVSFIGFVASQNRGIDSTRTYYRAIFFLMIFFLAGYGSVSYLNYQDPEYIAQVKERARVENEEFDLEALKWGMIICACLLTPICGLCTLCGYKLYNYSRRFEAISTGGTLPDLKINIKF